MNTTIRNHLSRRELFTLAATGVGAMSFSGWLQPLAAHAAAQGRKHKSCILLWMDGGPSHVETFDPKPEASAEVQGSLKAIQTDVPGIMIGEKFPKVAKLMKHGAVLRGMCTDEADHTRARIYMHTGYKPGVGGVTYPGLGSIVSAELGAADSQLPNFVVTGTPLNKYEYLSDPGFRGPLHQALALPYPKDGLSNLQPAVAANEFNDRISVLDQLEKGFARTHPGGSAEQRQETLTRALRLMRSDKGKVFDLSTEPAAVREKYGDKIFGQGCLLARRLVEASVPFTEIYLSNWDTHDKNTADQSRNLMTEVDNGLSALIEELNERGLLQDTLIVWMGEFGRSPRVNRNGGRDHYSKAWSSVLFGGGIKGGQTVGKSSHDASSVTDRPISAIDFMATVCQILGIDYKKEITTPNGRPIRIADKGEKIITELF